MILAARLSLSSSEIPDGFSRRSSNSFFSASAAACLRISADAFSASATAILFLQSAADGISVSRDVAMLLSKMTFTSAEAVRYVHLAQRKAVWRSRQVTGTHLADHSVPNSS